MKVGTIAEIWRYPVSSLRGERIEAVDLDGSGIVGDRTWGMVDAATGAIASPDDEKRWRVAPHLLARHRAEEPQIGTGDGLWHSAGSEAASVAAGIVVGFPVTFRRHAPFGEDAMAGTVSPRYARDQLHILTSASLRKLEALLPAGIDADPRRFRPNLVIETREEGFVEQDWIGRSLALGSARVRITAPCARCSFTALSQGELPFAPSVLHAITRHGNGGFGVLATVVERAELRVGDAAVLE